MTPSDSATKRSSGLRSPRTTRRNAWPATDALSSPWSNANASGISLVGTGEMVIVWPLASGPKTEVAVATGEAGAIEIFAERDRVFASCTEKIANLGHGCPDSARELVLEPGSHIGSNVRVQIDVVGHANEQPLGDGHLVDVF